jgi:hypothetical protein
MYKDVISGYLEMLNKLLAKTGYSFDEVSSSDLPRSLGVYVICDKRTKQIIYAGRSKNLRRRLLSDHRRGNIDGSQFRKAYGRSMGTTDEKEISENIQQNCTYGYLQIEKFEDAVRFEHFITAILGPILNTKLRQ